MATVITAEIIHQCKQDLIELKSHLLDRMSYLKNELVTLEKSSSEEGDQSINQVTEHYIFVNHRRIRHLLFEVESALMRIENGTFGFCEETGEAIEPARLKSIPYTRLSTEGAEIRDTRRNLMS
jgi:DnaK suppressor protein